MFLFTLWIGLLVIALIIVTYMGICRLGYWLNSAYDQKTPMYHPIRFGVGVIGLSGIAALVMALIGAVVAISEFGKFVINIL